MFARKLQPGDYWQARRVQAVAFENVFDQAEFEQTESEKVTTNADLYGASLAEDGPLVGAMSVNHFVSRFDGGTIKMGGVGGVAALPANRRGGAIRACMEKALRDMYDNGYGLSHLYPFSSAFYRQFGFAPAGQSLRWKVRLCDLQRLPDVGGNVRQIFPGDDLKPVLDIYNSMYGNINLSCLRDVFDQELEGGKPMKDKRWAFVWSDRNTDSKGFLAGSREENTLRCVPSFAQKNSLLFTDVKALIGLLNFVCTAYIANFEDIEFCVPDTINLTAILPEIGNMNCNPVLNGMARTVNAEMLLKMCLCRGEGTLVVQVADNILTENNAVFSLTFAPGTENTVSRTTQAPDIKLDAGNLAVLLGGARDTSTIAMTPDIALYNPNAPLENVFYRKPCHVLDFFYFVPGHGTVCHGPAR